MPEISRAPDELTAENTTSSGAKALADFLGPALAGLALLVLGAGWLFVAMGLAGLVSAGLVWRITVMQSAVDGTDMGSYWADAIQGARTVILDRAARALTLVAGARSVVFGVFDILAVM